MTNQTPPSSPPPSQQQQESVARQSDVEAARTDHATALIAAAPGYVAEGDDDDEFEYIVPRTTPGDCRDEERAFLLDFQEHIIALLRLCRHDFPFRQKVEWTTEYGNNREHTFHILIKPPRSAHHH